MDDRKGRPYYIRLIRIAPVVRGGVLVDSGASSDGVAEPPCAGFEGGDEIDPCPDFAQEGIAGGHSEKEEAGDGGNLHQAMGAPVPAEAPCTCAAIVPHDETGKYDQC